jgi:hypothetical protein
LKKFKVELLNALMKKRKGFDGLYKTFLMLVCKMEEKFGKSAS